MAEAPERERRLTVSTLREPRAPRSLYNPLADRVVPFLRLRGRSLEELGFRRGVKVAVVGRAGAAGDHAGVVAGGGGGRWLSTR